MATKHRGKKAEQTKVCQRETARRPAGKRAQEGKPIVQPTTALLNAPGETTPSADAQPVVAVTPARPTSAATPKEEEVLLVYGAEVEAQNVSVAGDFNGWSPDAHPLERISPTTYAATLKLPPGEYQYKFVVDGTWVEDPNAPRHVPNSHGSRNSVLLV